MWLHIIIKEMNFDLLGRCVLPVHQNGGEGSISPADVGEGETVKKLQQSHGADQHSSHILVQVRLSQLSL